MTEITENKVLTPTVVKLGLVSLFADISSEMLYPITPLFLTTVLGASMTSVGFIEGVAEAIANLLKTYSGVWSDRISRRKPFVVAGYLLSALAKPLTGVATAWTQVLFARGLDRTGKGLRGAPRDALLAEAVSPQFRGAAFGWHRAMDTLGAAIGPLIAIFYLTHFNSNNLRSIYNVALVPGLIAVILVLSIREPKAPATQIKKSVEIKLKWKDLPVNFKKYLLAWSLFSIANSSDVFLLLKAKDSGFGMIQLILLYCFYNLLYSLASPYFGKVSDRVPRKYVLIFGLVIFAFVYAGLSIATQSWHFWTLFGIYGLYMAATDGVGKALALDLIDPSLKATGLGLLGTLTGLSTVIASTVAGSLWDHFGAHWVFIYGTIGALCAAIFMLLVKENKISGEPVDA